LRPAAAGLLVLAVLGDAGCRASTPTPAPAGPAPAEQRQIVEQLIVQIQEEQDLWRQELGERTRLRERLVSLPGTAGLGLLQKRLQGLAQQGGLATAQLEIAATPPPPAVVTAHPVRLTAEGSWRQLLELLVRIEAQAPEMAVLDFAVQSLTRDGGGPLEVFRLQAEVGQYVRDLLPPPVSPLPPQAPLPADQAAAVRLLTTRLLEVQGARAGGRRELRHLQAALARTEEQAVPVRSFLAPLLSRLGGVRLTVLAANRQRLLLEGAAPDPAEVEGLVQRLTQEHPFLRPLAPVLGRRQVHPGWETTFTLTCVSRDQAPAAPTPAQLLAEPPPPAPPISR
jgi:hypothetical protein